MTDTKAPEIFGEQRARAAKSDDPDLRITKDGLAGIAEESSLAIVHGVAVRRASDGRRRQSAKARAHDGGAGQLYACVAGKPDITSNRVLREDKSANGHALGDVQ